MMRKGRSGVSSSVFLKDREKSYSYLVSYSHAKEDRYYLLHSSSFFDKPDYYPHIATMPPSIHGVPIPEWPQKLRRLLPRQNDAVAAKTARAIALGDPVQPAPVTTDPFATDFGQFNEFTLAQGPIYPHQFQTQMFRPPDDGMVAPHSRGTTGWEGQMQPGWGRISGRNAAGVGQLSVDTSTSQMMYGMGNAAGKLRIASDTENHARACTDSLPKAPYGGMDLVSPTSSEPQSFPMLNRMTDC
jgi:hypothetical protein